ncbi:MAG TPA: class I adenylate-forming enzyme family protein [Bacillota bacterium]|nr:class I adenylate-forming enzyme family protein [Bacillota bacterium]
MKFEKPTLDCVLRSIADEFSTKPAIIFEDLEITYRDLYSRSKNLALGLKALGIVKNDKVAVLLPNCLEYMYVYFGLFLLGAWAVPLSTRYEPDELRNILGDSDAKMIIYQDRIGTFDYNQILSTLKPDLPLLQNYICFGKSELPGAILLADLLTKNPSPEPAGVEWDNIEPDDVALLAYTSGTTGSPKGVMIPHKNLVLTSYETAQLWDVKDEVAFSVAPLYAAQGFLAILIDLVAGVTMKWISNFNPNDILAHLVRQGVTAFHTQPTMWTILVSLPVFEHINFQHLKKVVVSGSLCSYHLAKRIQDSVGCTLLNAYGLIEATGVVTITQPEDSEDVRLNTVGRPIPGVAIKIVDEQRREVKKGEIGELAVRGYLMKGYYKNEAKTRAIIDDEGWLYTGDLACYYDDGVNIRIVGRCKDMVIRGGFNVYPIDIEECLLTSDKIEDVAVVGKEDDILGESLVAFVIPKPDVELSSAEVKMYCRGKIANYKIPDEVYFVSQFPILVSGKVRKNILAEWAVTGIPEENRLLFNSQTMEK